MKHKVPALALLACAVAVGTALAGQPSRASDHDDITETSNSNNTNLTDLYVFKEKTQNSAAADDALIFVMNCNPRSVAGFDYTFNPKARYEFHIGRVGVTTDNDKAPTGKADVTLRFEFSERTGEKNQAITFTPIFGGAAETPITNVTSGGAKLLTTTMAQGGNPLKNEFQSKGSTLALFAGLREDPFFFDVNQFIKIRTAAANKVTPLPSFKPTGSDFAAGFNVLSIVLRAPRSYFQQGSSATTFDVWETVSVKK